VLDTLIDYVSRLWDWAKREPKQAALVLSCLAFLDAAVLDRWGLRGRTVDIQGRSISGVWIVGVFYGKKPLINLPLPPHPKPRQDTCMDVKITKSGPFGFFSFDELTFNRPVAEKHVYLIAFKEGWLDRTGSTSIASSLFSISPMNSIVLTPGPGKRRTALVNSATLTAALSPHELTFSEEFFSTTTVIDLSLSQHCGSAGIPVAAFAMQRALQIAETFDERVRARATCRGAKSDISRMIRDKEAAKRLWPFDCKNLAFAKSPSKETLAMERELRKQERHANESLAPGGSPAHSTETDKPVH
jgi:hypothetical protein